MKIPAMTDTDASHYVDERLHGRISRPKSYEVESSDSRDWQTQTNQLRTEVGAVWQRFRDEDPRSCGPEFDSLAGC